MRMTLLFLLFLLFIALPHLSFPDLLSAAELYAKKWTLGLFSKPEFPAEPGKLVLFSGRQAAELLSDGIHVGWERSFDISAATFRNAYVDQAAVIRVLPAIYVLQGF